MPRQEITILAIRTDEHSGHFYSLVHPHSQIRAALGSLGMLSVFEAFVIHDDEALSDEMLSVKVGRSQHADTPQGPVTFQSMCSMLQSNLYGGLGLEQETADDEKDSTERNNDNTDGAGDQAGIDPSPSG